MYNFSEMFYYIKCKMHRHKLVKTNWLELLKSHNKNPMTHSYARRCDCCKTRDIQESWHCAKCSYDVCIKCMESNGKFAVKQYNTEVHDDIFLSAVYTMPIIFIAGTFGIGSVVAVPFMIIGQIPAIPYIIYRKFTGWNIASESQNWGMFQIRPSNRKLEYYSKHYTVTSHTQIHPIAQ
jgi:hypothetical protein